MTARQHQSVAADAAHVEPTPVVSVHVSTPVGLLSAIPYLLEFQPANSLVIVGTDLSSHKAKVALRYDLPDPPDPETTGAIIAHVAAILIREHSTRAFAVGYGPSNLVTPIIDKLVESGSPAGLTVAEILWAENGRYWSYQSDQPDWCSGEGTPFDPNADPVDAGFVASKSRVLASREELAATVATLSGTAATSMRRATRRAEDRAVWLAPREIATMGLKAVAEAIACYRSGGKLSPGAGAAWLALVLRDPWVRDDAWCRMVPEHCKEHLKLWTDVTRLARPGYVAAPASLLAVVAGQSGNGALANVALDRALADNPQYSMAQLLRRAIASGAGPALLDPPMTPEEVAADYSDQYNKPQRQEGNGSSND